MRFLSLLGRVLFAWVFVRSAPAHFQEQSIGYLSEQGIPFAPVLVPLSGFLALVGGVSVLLGWRAKAGAWLLVAFLVPVTLLMHPFWAVSDPAAAAIQEAMFYKNLSMLGGALLICRFGAGPIAMDAWKHEPDLHEFERPRQGDDAQAA
jgi:putative oxidoreductase